VGLRHDILRIGDWRERRVGLRAERERERSATSVDQVSLIRGLLPFEVTD